MRRNQSCSCSRPASYIVASYIIIMKVQHRSLEITPEQVVMSSSSALDKIYLCLIRYLNVDSIKPHLKQSQLLTDEEFEYLSSANRKTSQSAVETLVHFIKRKGPSHELDFLSALKNSMQFDPHQGHVEVIAALEESLALEAGRAGDMLPVEESEQDVLETDFANPNPLDIEPHKNLAALRSKVVKANNDIRLKFAKLVLDVYRILSKLKVAVDEIRLSLLYLGCFRDKSGAGCPLLDPASDLSRVDTVQSLIACLHQYSSWYNYGLIKFVATEFGGEEGATVIVDYLKSLTSYCERIVACQCPEFSLADGVPPGYDQLVVKVDWDHLTRTAQDIAIFQAELSTLLNLEPEVFILKGVEEGCVLITWVVPQAITGHIIVSSMKHHQQLAKLGILHVITAGKFIDVHKDESAENRVTPVSLSPLTDALSQSSILSSSYATDRSSPDTPVNILSGCDITTMTPDEVEIISTYSGRSRSSVYSTVSQFSSSTVGLGRGKQFHSECDILLAKPPFPDQVRRSSLPPDDSIMKTPNSSKRKQAKRLFKSMLPKLFQRKVSNSKATGATCVTPTTDCSEADIANFPILDLSEEPTVKKEGKRVYSHYYCDSIAASESCAALSVESPSTAHFLDNSDLNQLTSGPVEELEDEEKHSVDQTYSSQSDIDSNAGSQSTLPNVATSEYDLHHESSDDYTSSVQRSQSMKYPSSNHPQSDARRNRRLSYACHILSAANPSSHASSLSSYERVDTPSSGYCGSQSGTCSMQSSLYSLGSSYPLEGCGSDTPDNTCTQNYKCSSLKRNSITATGVDKSKSGCKKSSRSYSFNDKYTMSCNTTSY